MKYLQLMRPAIGIVLLYILYIHTYCICHCRLTKSYILHYVAHVSMLISPAICSAMLMLHVHMCVNFQEPVFCLSPCEKQQKLNPICVCPIFLYIFVHMLYI